LVLAEFFHPSSSTSTSSSSSSYKATVHAVRESSDAAILHCLQERGPQVVATLQGRLDEAEERQRIQTARREKALRQTLNRKETLEAILYRLDAEMEENLKDKDSRSSASSFSTSKDENRRRDCAQELASLEHEQRYLTQLQQVMTLLASSLPYSSSSSSSSYSSPPSILITLESLLSKRSPHEFPELDRYVCEAAKEIILPLKEKWLIKLGQDLEACGWPPAMGRKGGGEGGMGGDEVVLWSREVKEGIGRLVGLQAIAQKFQVGSAVDILGHRGGREGMSVLWVSEELSLPLLERFVFHFGDGRREGWREGGSGGSSKDIADRPDWMFAYLLRALRLSRQGLMEEVAEGGVKEWMPELFERLPHPLLALFARDLALAARTKVRGLLVSGGGGGEEGGHKGGAWLEDEFLVSLAEEALSFDKALDEEVGYHHFSAATAGGGCGGSGLAAQGITFPRVVDVLTASSERLKHWAELEARWVMASLTSSCTAPGAWEAAAGRREGEKEGVQPTPAAQAFAGLLGVLCERYGGLRDVRALRVLVERTVKPMVRLYLSYVYDEAKALRLGGSVCGRKAGWDGVLRSYLSLVASTHVAIEAVEDAGSDVTFLRLEGGRRGTEEGQEGGALNRARQAGVVASALASSLLAAGQETVRTATATTENFTRAVEESGSIIGPTRLLSKALGSLSRAVVTTASAGAGAGAGGGRGRGDGEGGRGGGEDDVVPPGSPCSSFSLLEKLTVSLTPPRVATGRDSPLRGGGGGGEGSEGGREGGSNSSPRTPGGKEREASALEGAVLRLEDKGGREGGIEGGVCSVLGAELLHLRSFQDGMLEDALVAITAGFHDSAADYLGHLPPALVPTLEPSPCFLPALTFLDSVLSVAAQALERDALLRLWQGLVYTVSSSYLRKVKGKGCWVISEGGAKQMVVDVDALAKVLTREGGREGAGGGLNPEGYLKRLTEAVEVLAWPPNRLESMYLFLDNLIDDANGNSGGGREGGEEAAAVQIQDALEAKGLVTLSAEEVMALVEQRRRGDEVAASNYNSSSNSSSCGGGRSSGPQLR